MKKVLPFFTAIAMTVGVCCYSYLHDLAIVKAESDLDENVIGDLNADNKIDMTDFSICSLYLIGDKDLSYNQKKLADFDNDEDVTLADLARYCQFLSKNVSQIEYYTCYCYGDSLTWYDGHNFTWGAHKGELCVGFEYYLATDLKLAVSNRGISGATTPQICSKIINDSDIADADIVMIMGGDNDDRLLVDVGTLSPKKSTFDVSTVYGSLQNTVEKISAVNENAHIILMTEPIGWTYKNDEMQRVDPKYPDAYRKVAELYGLQLIDNWNNSGIDETNRNEYTIDPQTDNKLYIYHPSNSGWKKISDYIVSEISKYF